MWIGQLFSARWRPRERMRRTAREVFIGAFPKVLQDPESRAATRDTASARPLRGAKMAGRSDRWSASDPTGATDPDRPALAQEGTACEGASRPKLADTTSIPSRRAPARPPQPRHRCRPRRAPTEHGRQCRTRCAQGRSRRRRQRCRVSSAKIESLSEQVATDIRCARAALDLRSGPFARQWSFGGSESDSDLPGRVVVASVRWTRQRSLRAGRASCRTRESRSGPPAHAFSAARANVTTTSLPADRRVRDAEAREADFPILRIIRRWQHRPSR